MRIKKAPLFTLTALSTLIAASSSFAAGLPPAQSIHTNKLQQESKHQVDNTIPAADIKLLAGNDRDVCPKDDALCLQG